MTTPDTTPEQQELVDNLLHAVIEWHQNYEPATDPAQMADDLAEPIAAICRQAAADALFEEARSIEKIAAFMRQQGRAMRSKGDEKGADGYDFAADARYACATKLRRAAADKIAEGYEYECAAFSQECDARVPDAGDFCSRHEPEDDENPWAE